MAFVTDQTYELKLSSKFDTSHRSYYGYVRDYGNWFGLLQISGFSNYGNYFFYVSVVI